MKLPIKIITIIIKSHMHQLTLPLKITQNEPNFTPTPSMNQTSGCVIHLQRESSFIYPQRVIAFIHPHIYLRDWKCSVILFETPRRKSSLIYCLFFLFCFSIWELSVVEVHDVSCVHYIQYQYCARRCEENLSFRA